MNSYPNLFLPRILKNIKEKSYNILTYSYTEFLADGKVLLEYIKRHLEQVSPDSFDEFLTKYNRDINVENEYKLYFYYRYFDMYLEIIESIKEFANPQISIDRMKIDSIFGMDKESFKSSLNELSEKSIIIDLEIQSKESATFIINEKNLYKYFYYTYKQNDTTIMIKPAFYEFKIFPTLFKKINTVKYSLLSVIIENIDPKLVGVEIFNSDLKDRYYVADIDNEYLFKFIGIGKSNLNKSLYDLHNTYKMISYRYDQTDATHLSNPRKFHITPENQLEIEIYTSEDGYKFPSNLKDIDDPRPSAKIIYCKDKLF